MDAAGFFDFKGWIFFPTKTIPTLRIRSQLGITNYLISVKND